MLERDNLQPLLSRALWFGRIASFFLWALIIFNPISFGERRFCESVGEVIVQTDSVSSFQNQEAV